jgi:hypothetical protein
MSNARWWVFLTVGPILPDNPRIRSSVSTVGRLASPTLHIRGEVHRIIVTATPLSSSERICFVPDFRDGSHSLGSGLSRHHCNAAVVIQTDERVRLIPDFRLHFLLTDKRARCNRVAGLVAASGINKKGKVHMYQETMTPRRPLQGGVPPLSRSSCHDEW